MRGDAQLVDQAILERAIQPLAAPAGLGRVGRNVLDAEPGQGAARPASAASCRPGPWPAACETPSARGRCRAPSAARASAITSPQRRHDRRGAFARPQLGVQHALGRIVEHRDQAPTAPSAPTRATGADCHRGAATRQNTRAAPAGGDAGRARGPSSPTRASCSACLTKLYDSVTPCSRRAI